MTSVLLDENLNVFFASFYVLRMLCMCFLEIKTENLIIHTRHFKYKIRYSSLDRIWLIIVGCIWRGSHILIIAGLPN